MSDPLPAPPGYRIRRSVAVMTACRRRLLARGVSALEFALVAPLVILVVFFSLEVGIMMWADASLETTAMQVSRIGQLGVPEGKTCEQEVRGMLEQKMGRWVYDPSSLRVDVRIYTPGEDISLPDPDDEDYQPVCDTGSRGDMVIYRLSFDRPGFTGVMAMLGTSVFRIERTVIIQNEP